MSHLQISHTQKDSVRINSTVIGHKNQHTKKSAVFLFTDNEQLEKEIKKIILFTRASKRSKYLGINLTEGDDTWVYQKLQNTAKIKKDTNNGKTSHVHGMEDLRCQYEPSNL